PFFMVSLAVACAALVLLWPQWRDELRAQNYTQEFCVGKITGVAPAQGSAPCRGLKMDDVACVPCPPNGMCAAIYECTLSFPIESGVCQVVVEIEQDATCRACPENATELNPAKKPWQRGWFCKPKS